MWESFLGICMQLRDVQGVIQSMRQLADLDQTARIQERRGSWGGGPDATWALLALDGGHLVEADCAPC